ncbi:MAG: DNA polymerase Y family protein [Pseudomonadota bacterium]
MKAQNRMGTRSQHDASQISCSGAVPHVVIRRRAGSLFISAVCSHAAEQGIAPGMALADARALEPNLITSEEDCAADLRMLTRLADWAERYSPRVSLEGLDGNGGAGLWIDVSGAAHLFGGEEALLRDLCARLLKRGFCVRAAIADTASAAWAAARFFDGPETFSVKQIAASQGQGSGRTGVADAGGVIVPQGRSLAMLSHLPLEALRVDQASVVSLRRMGLVSIGALLDVPRVVIANRYGRQIADHVDRFTGMGDEPMKLRRVVPQTQSRMTFGDPILSREDIQRSVQHLLISLCDDLSQNAQGARRLELTVFRVDGEMVRLSVGTARPVRDSAALNRLFREKLDHIDAGFGIEVMALCAVAVDPLEPRQETFLGVSQEKSRSHARHSREDGRGSTICEAKVTSTSEATRSGTGAGAAPNLEGLVDRLGNRLGFAALRRLTEVPVHRPEHGVDMVPVDAKSHDGENYPHGTVPTKRRARQGHTDGHPDGFLDGCENVTSQRAPRPVRLRRYPSPVDVMSDGSGRPLAINRARMMSRRISDNPVSHDGQFQRLAAAEGPEVIGSDWSLASLGKTVGSRAYWRVETHEGERLWMFRQSSGNFGSASSMASHSEGARLSSDEWFLHGTFA